MAAWSHALTPSPLSTSSPRRFASSLDCTPRTGPVLETPPSPLARERKSWSLNSLSSLQEGRTLYETGPDLPLHPEPTKELPPLHQLRGPTPCEEAIAIKDFFYGLSISTYPVHPITMQREGDPICDAFGASLYSDGTATLVVADGCSWGTKPREAAITARDSFINYVNKRRHKFKTSHDIGHYLLRALHKSNDAILGNEQCRDGTTTLLGGYLTPIRTSTPELVSASSCSSTSSLCSSSSASSLPSSPNTSCSAIEFTDGLSKLTFDEFLFVGVSIGDCKAFRFNIALKQFEDITLGNRENYTNCGSDPGGRLGEAIPDVRNLSVFSAVLGTDDVLCLLSDGVYDNLDARHLGLVPTELGLTQDNWGDLPCTEEARLKQYEWMIKNCTTEILSEAATPQSIATAFTEHCMKTTANSRAFMQENPRVRLPKDYKKFKGKMDHSTILAFHPALYSRSCSEQSTPSTSLEQP